MRISPETVAERLLVDFGVTTPPVPIDDIVRRMGIDLVFEPFDGELSGILYQEENQAIIAVNDRNSKVRQRFTIAHECGHYLMHQQDRDLFVDKPIQVQFRNQQSSLAVNREEIAANRFAAALLMPRSWIVGEANRRLECQPPMRDDELLLDLARLFDVSQQAMEYRLANLGVWAPL